jgi:hypothetical protein
VKKPSSQSRLRKKAPRHKSASPAQTIRVAVPDAPSPVQQEPGRAEALLDGRTAQSVRHEREGLHVRGAGTLKERALVWSARSMMWIAAVMMDFSERRKLRKQAATARRESRR